ADEAGGDGFVFAEELETSFGGAALPDERDGGGDAARADLAKRKQTRLEVVTGGEFRGFVDGATPTARERQLDVEREAELVAGRGGGFGTGGANHGLDGDAAAKTTAQARLPRVTGIVPVENNGTVPIVAIGVGGDARGDDGVERRTGDEQPALAQRDLKTL